jgi:hypothetical protein
MGISNVLADALSMGAGEFLSSRAYNNYIKKELERETWELDNYPEGEASRTAPRHCRPCTRHRCGAESPLTHRLRLVAPGVKICLAVPLDSLPPPFASPDGPSVAGR